MPWAAIAPPELTLDSIDKLKGRRVGVIGAGGECQGRRYPE